MSFMTMLTSRMFGLPPAVYHKLEYQIDLPVPMPDGVVLLANRIAPIDGETLPIILIRNPYTSRGKKPDLVSQLIAERGYQVVVQNCRGTWGSEGEFQPFRADREDGLATLQWLAEQPWFSGCVGMFGLSYWGYAQLALGPGAPDFLQALVPQMSASRLYGVFRAYGSLSLNTLLTWNYNTYVMNAQESPAAKRQAKRRRSSVLRQVFMHLPVSEADQVAFGFTVHFFQEILRNDQPDDALWAMMDHSKIVPQICAPVHFIAGWYDFFLKDELADYESLRAAGKQPYLTIGPWMHGDTPSLKAEFKESIAWYDAHLKGNRVALRSSPVRVYVMGVNKWVNLPSWPPPSMATKWYLQAGGGLTSDAPAEHVDPSCYRYDPADPTPSVGGAVALDGGAKDNRKLEARPDVLTFTSKSMVRDTTIMGTVSTVLYVRSTTEHTDFFVRLCDVSPNGKKSINICDGIVRLSLNSNQADYDGIRWITIDLLPTAYCFRKGHHIRLQVSSGAHPMHIRNLGTGEPIVTGTLMRTADQEVFHDTTHPSAVVFPIFQLSES
jgi:putative CocE/NonD family hydrolase